MQGHCGLTKFRHPERKTLRALREGHYWTDTKGFSETLFYTYCTIISRQESHKADSLSRCNLRQAKVHWSRGMILLQVHEVPGSILEWTSLRKVMLQVGNGLHSLFVSTLGFTSNALGMFTAPFLSWGIYSWAVVHYGLERRKLHTKKSTSIIIWLYCQIGPVD
jgi:hypothetical protein